MLIINNVRSVEFFIPFSDELKAHLREVAINRALSTFVSSNDKFIDLRDHVARLSSMLGLDSY
jgi:hypothetical protein